MGCESSSWGQLLTKVHCLQSCWLLPCIHVERPVSAAAPKHSIAQGMLSEVMAFMVTQPQGSLADAAYLSLQSILHKGPACGRMMPEAACCLAVD